jgi:hypothetical protein
VQKQNLYGFCGHKLCRGSSLYGLGGCSGGGAARGTVTAGTPAPRALKLRGAAGRIYVRADPGITGVGDRTSAFWARWRR